MLSQIPIDLSKVSGENIVRELLRVGMIAELDAASLYEQLAARADDPLVRKVFLDIAKEEKTHAGEFLELLLRHDKQQEEELKKGKEEVKGME